MSILKRKRAFSKRRVGLGIAVILAAHVAAGVIVCSGKRRCCSPSRAVRKATRAVSGFVKKFS